MPTGRPKIGNLSYKSRQNLQPFCNLTQSETFPGFIQDFAVNWFVALYNCQSLSRFYKVTNLFQHDDASAWVYLLNAHPNSAEASGNQPQFSGGDANDRP
jgi:hypothetical protein